MNMFVQSQFCLSRLKSLALGSQDDGSGARAPYDDARQDGGDGDDVLSLIHKVKIAIF